MMTPLWHCMTSVMPIGYVFRLGLKMIPECVRLGRSQYGLLELLLLIADGYCEAAESDDISSAAFATGVREMWLLLLLAAGEIRVAGDCGMSEPMSSSSLAFRVGD